MKLSENTVLITGGGSGIGLALAKAFTQRRNTVIVCGRTMQKLQAVQRDYPAIAIFRCDIANDDDQRRLVEHITQRYPDLNMLINNAGIQNNYNFVDGQDHTSAIEGEIGINFSAQVKLVDRLLPMLLRRSSAAIVNVTSALALVPKQNAPVYCAAKAAMRSFTKVLRYQLEDTPVKVFEVIPALVDTEMTKGRGKDKMTPEAVAAEALRGMGADKHEIRIGKTKALFVLHRFLPSLAESILRGKA